MLLREVCYWLLAEEWKIELSLTANLWAICSKVGLSMLEIAKGVVIVPFPGEIQQILAAIYPPVSGLRRSGCFKSCFRLNFGWLLSRLEVAWALVGVAVLFQQWAVFWALKCMEIRLTFELEECSYQLNYQISSLRSILDSFKKHIGFYSQIEIVPCYSFYCINILPLCMDVFHNTLDQINTFIYSQDFFWWHGVVLAVLWFFAALVAIFLRKVSIILHAISFFIIDVITVFFLVGAMLRVYPHLENFSSWSLIKQGHIVGGAVFLVFLVLQHIGGVSTLLKGIKYNPTHRKFAVVVTNLGRILAVFGFVMGKFDQKIIIGSAVLALLLLVGSVWKVFFADSERPVKRPNLSSSESPSARQKSPKRD